MTTTSPRGRRALSRPWVAALVVALLVALTPRMDAWAQDPDLEDQLDEAQDNLDEAQAEQARIAAQVGSAQATVAALDLEIHALETELREREAELAEATTIFEEARVATEAVEASLALVTDDLRASQARLEGDRSRFDSRVAATYMYGGPLAMADVLFQSQDFGEFVRTGYYIESILEDDKSLIDRVADETRQIAHERTEIDRLRDQLATEEASAERARQAVARATDLHRTITARVEAERAERASTLAALESDLATYTELVAAYQAESDRIAQELANSRWRAGAPGAGELLWPTNGSAGSGYGYRTHPIFGTRRLHSGVDIGAPLGQDIVAAAEGLVIEAGWKGGYGLAVVIDHGGGLATLYAHQSRLLVSDGQVVTAGQVIGEVGSTGQSTGPHLHFEVRVDGVPRDPMEWY